MNATNVVRPGFVVECPDQDLAEALTRWLAGSCLTWPAAFRIRARIVPALTTLTDERVSFPQEGIEIQAGPPDGTVRIRWTDFPAEAVVSSDEPIVDLAVTPDALAHFEMAERGFFLVALVFVLRRIGWYHVHGAALIDPRGRGWMFVGNSRTGKSTTTALLAGCGWTVATDDIAFLQHAGTVARVHGFRSPIALRSGGHQLLSSVRQLGTGSDFSRRQKRGYSPEELGGRWTETVVPEILLFPTIGTETSIAPMRPSEVLSELVTWSHWVLYEPLHAQEHLDLLGRLAGQARGVRATFGPDLIRRPTLLQELIP